MQCPVCKTESDHAEICPRCHFKLRVFISMTPEEEVQYKAELEKARKEWKLRCEMPAFERDVFETREEFKARIESQNPYPAGKAKLLRNKYDIDRAIFPIEIQLDDWTQPFGFTFKNPFIEAPRDLARSLYLESEIHPIRAMLSVENGKIVALSWELFGLNQKIPIRQEMSEKQEKPNNGRFVNSIGMEFVLIPPGTFMMGSPEDEPGRSDNEVRHQVTLTKGFYMQTTPVTVGQWRMFTKESGYKSQAETEDGSYYWTGKNWEKNKNRFWDSPGFEQTDDHPVTCVSWNDTQEFIQWLTRKDHKPYRLPTEAEWEYACRAGTESPFWTGKCLGTNQANYDGNFPLEGCPKGEYRKRTTPVLQFPPNPWGLHDMHGNVWEWCADQCDRSKEENKVITDTYVDGIVDPLCRKGPVRVVRGGSWLFIALLCRSAARLAASPGYRGTNFGFRLALSHGQQVSK